MVIIKKIGNDSRIPFINSDGIKIYYETEESGQPIVLVHGFSSDLNSWKGTSWVKTLKDKYQVIMLDCRGRGKSDKPHEFIKYSLKAMNSDLIKLLDHLSIKKANFFGYSMGAALVFQLLLQEPKRFISAILGGFVLNFLKDEVERNRIRDNVNKRIATLKAESIELIKDPMEHAFRQLSEATGNDLIALAAASGAVLHYPTDWEAHPEQTKKLLKRNRIPILTAVGSNDFPSADKTLVARVVKNACHFQIYGKNHMNMLKAPQLKMMVKAFLNDVNTKG